MVRATLRMRSWARAVSPCCCMARSRSFSASGPSSQIGANLAGSHLRVGVDFFFGLGESLALELARGEHAGANVGRAFAGGSSAQFAVLDGGNLDVDVDAIEQRAGDL